MTALTASMVVSRPMTMSKYNLPITRFFTAVASLGLLACGMAEDEQDDRNRHIYLSFSDAAFETFCLERYDLNGDGRISRYESERVLNMDCSGCGIRFLDDMKEFARLKTLRCADNALTSLDVEPCTELEVLDCARNALTELRIDGLRSLAEINCSENQLSQLELRAAGSLRRLDARANRFRMLDLSPCLVALQANVRQNPQLETVYYRAGQQVDFESPTALVER